MIENLSVGKKLLSNLKKVLKFGLIHLMARIGRHYWPFQKDQLLILTSYRTLPGDTSVLRFEQPGMYVKPETLAMHIDTLLQEGFEIVSLSDWLKKKQRKESLPAKAVAITFDDGWRDNFTYALPILKDKKCPATIFVVSRLVGYHGDFWPGRLAKAVLHIAATEKELWQQPEAASIKELFGELKDLNTISIEEFDRAISGAKIFSDSQMHSMLDDLEEAFKTPLAEERVLIDEVELRGFVDSGLIDIGSHTCDHIRLLDTLSVVAMQEQVVDSAKELKLLAKQACELFCFPNGDYSEQSLELVKENYLAACTTVHGWNNAGSDMHLLRRVNMHEDMTNTRIKFLARIGSFI